MIRFFQAFCLFILLIAVAWKIERARLDAYLDGDVFRAKISEETSRGLKVEGQFSPLTHHGLTALTDRFDSVGRPGEAIASMTAEGITSKFDPWGVLLRRWQVDRITIDHTSLVLRPPDDAAKVPLPVHPKPWYNFILPQRFYLKEVLTPDADILCKIEGKLSGLRHVPMRVTPYGKKDWRFEGYGGTLDLPKAPPLRVAFLSFVVTKPYLYVEHATLVPDTEGDPGRLELQGTIGMQPQDEHLNAAVRFFSLPIAPWLPDPWKNRIVGGRLSGELDWIGPRTPAGGWGRGDFDASGTVLTDLEVLRELSLLTQNRAWDHLELKKAATSWEWDKGIFTLKMVDVEAPGLCRILGTFQVEKGRLSGVLHLGIAPESLKWLPPAGQALFQLDPTRDPGTYHWADAHLSGTVEKPEDDLSPQLRHVIVTSPGTLLKVGFDTLGAWLGLGK